MWPIVKSAPALPCSAANPQPLLPSPGCRGWGRASGKTRTRWVLLAASRQACSKQAARGGQPALGAAAAAAAGGLGNATCQ